MSQDDLNRQAFIEEAQDLLSELETALLELEDSPEDGETIDRVFRAMHTIKGSGAMFGFDDIASFTHDVETVFDRVRNGELPVSREILDLTLKSRDHISALLNAFTTGVEADKEFGSSLTTRLKALSGAGGGADQSAVPESSGPPDSLVPEDMAASMVYRVRFKPGKEIFFSGTNPLVLLDELAEMGTARIISHMEQVPELDQVEPELCYMWWDVILVTSEDANAIRDVFLFVEDDCELLVQLIDQGGMLDDEEATKKLGEILVDRGDITKDDLRSVLSEQKRLGTLLSEKGAVSEAAVASALAEQEVVTEVRKARAQKQGPARQEVASSIRVAAEKLDYLVDLVGELVIVQAQISQVVGEKRDPGLTGLAEELERLSDELRDSTLGIRMLPIGTTFSKFRRLVRDLSADLGKEINLTMHGGETELDKTVLERLNDPLVHLLRNSIDHGVEQPAVRTEAGKDPAGSITLSAEHSGGEVHIRIVDDGKGIDPEVIRNKAVSKGLIRPDAEMSDRDIFSLIFMAGFSTAEQVTSVSGRGVGMDVVKRAIDSLRGTVIIDSELGKGTTITVKLPLTLAIIDGLQVKVGEEYYVIPLPLVEECVELIHKDESKKKDQIVNLRGEIVPYIRLKEWFEVETEDIPIEQIVVVSVQDTRIGIVVDNVIGEHQTVIKSLGRVYRDVEGISGATIKGDGTMALILDVPKLIQTAVESQ